MKRVIPPLPPGRRNKKRGAVTLLLAAVGVAMFGVAALAFDLAWFYVVKSELQNFTDAASIAAATQARRHIRRPGCRRIAGA